MRSTGSFNTEKQQKWCRSQGLVSVIVAIERKNSDTQTLNAGHLLKLSKSLKGKQTNETQNDKKLDRTLKTQNRSKGMRFVFGLT